MKNKNYDKKIFRLVSILNKLNNGGKVSSGKLAQEFNVSIRSVQRDLDLLNTAGFPLDMNEKGVYSFMPGFSLKKVMLTNEEASLLTFFHEIADSLGKNFSESFRSLVTKVLSRDDGSPFYVKLPEVQGAMKNLPFMNELERAIRESKKVSISYEGAKKTGEYKVCPLKLINFDGFWYLLAMPDKKREFRKFRSEKIKGLRLLNEPFDPPRNVKSVLDRSVNIWFNETPGEKILLDIDKDAAHYFKKKIYFPEQRIVKEKKDGSLVLETRANFNEVIRTIIHWIPDIRVISPRTLDGRIRELLSAYLKGSRPRWG